MTKVIDNIIQMDYSEEMKTSYRNYAMSVIIARALPDVRDGLKPVQRRILYAMRELGLDPKKPHRKSARIVGDTMGKFHPHGDSSIYDALVRMTEDYSLSIPLVDGHGNFGSIDGDGAAAMRYTEARLSEGAMSMLEHLEKGLVSFLPNFDDSELEPTVLPAMIPNLLINGTTGIAVGMATNIPPHNPGEVIDGTIAYMNNPNITVEGLMKYIPAPDFPTGGIIVNYNDIPQIYESGDGRIRVRSRVEIEPGDNGRKNIIVTEIPYTIAGNKTKLVESLSALMKDKVFDEIFDVRDESSKEGIRIVIEVKKDRDIDNLLNGLYKKTPLEDTYGVNLLAVKEQQPIVFNLKSLIKEFVTFQEELYTKEYQHILDKALSRQEIVSGLIKATDVIDLIIEILRGSSSVKQAKGCLIHGDITDIKFKTKESEKEASTLNFTEKQAEAILSMALSKLIGLEILKLHEEDESLAKTIENCRAVLSSREELYKIIKQRLKDYKKAFTKKRMTTYENSEASAYIEEVKVEDIYILVDRFGYTKSIDASSYTRAGEDTIREYAHVVCMKNTDKICIFTAEGNMYQVKASQIPKGKIKDKGVLIQTLCKVDKENILLYAAFEQVYESQLLFSTSQGYIKLVSGVEFETNRSTINSTKLEEGDSLVQVTMLRASEVMSDDMKVILLTQKGASLGFALSEVSEMKKTGRGVKSAELDKNDSIVYTTVVKTTTEVFYYDGNELSAKKVKNRKRGQKPQKAQLS